MKEILTRKDIKQFKAQDSNLWKYGGSLMMLGCMALLLVLSYLHLELSFTVGAKAGLTPSEIFSSYSNGIKGGCEYKGTHVMALVFMDKAAIKAVVALFFPVFGIT
jgi:hypothetical protein